LNFPAAPAEEEGESQEITLLKKRVKDLEKENKELYKKQLQLEQKLNEALGIFFIK
jgi:predicted RNase H-like nuclease (RuvC/YqgF family)